MCPYVKKIRGYNTRSNVENVITTFLKVNALFNSIIRFSFSYCAEH